MVHQTSIAFVGDYSPRRCGIATFTSDICEAIAAQPQVNSNIFAVAVNDVPDGYPYSPRVRFEIREKVLAVRLPAAVESKSNSGSKAKPAKSDDSDEDGHPRKLAAAKLKPAAKGKPARK